MAVSVSVIIRMYSRTPLIRTQVFFVFVFFLFLFFCFLSDWLGPSIKFVENFTELTCLEITGCGIRYSTVLWLVAHQIRRGRRV